MARLDPTEYIDRALVALEAIRDPLERAQSATELMQRIVTANEQIREMRHQDVAWLNDKLEGPGYTYEELSELLGVSKPRIQQLVNNYREPRREGTIAVAMKVPLASLHRRKASDEDIVRALLPRIRSYRGGPRLTVEQVAEILDIPAKTLKPLMAVIDAEIAAAAEE